MRPSTRVAALVLAASLTAACSGTGDPAADATAPPIGNPTVAATAEPEPSPTPTATESATEDWTVPDDIDATYVERVLNRLEETYHDGFEALRAADGDVGPESWDRFAAIYDDDLVDDLVTALIGLKDEGYPNVLPSGETGPRTAEVTDVLQADPSCVYVRALMDGAPYLVEPTEVDVTYYVLRAVEPSDLNPTGWEVAEGFGPASPEEDEVVGRAEPCDG